MTAALERVSQQIGILIVPHGLAKVLSLPDSLQLLSQRFTLVAKDLERDLCIIVKPMLSWPSERDEFSKADIRASYLRAAF